MLDNTAIWCFLMDESVAQVGREKQLVHDEQLATRMFNQKRKILLKEMANIHTNIYERFC